MIGRNTIATLACTFSLGLISSQDSDAKTFVLDLDQTAPAGQLSLSAIPASPNHHVSDSAGSLPAPLLEQVTQRINEPGSPPVYLAISDQSLPENISAESYTNEVLRRWDRGTHPLAALVLSIPRPMATIHIAVAGRNLSSEEAQTLKAMADSALAKMPSQADFTEAAAAAAIDLHQQLRAFAPAPAASPETAAELPVAATARRSKVSESDVPALPAPSSHWEALSRKVNWDTVRFWSVVAGSILFTVCGFFLLLRFKNRRGLLLPEHLPRKRFSAPFAGGSNAQTTYQ